ncbi:MAG: adenylyltransferase/cytidyltransferase family protein, partial [Terracidiphilus sp.]
MIPIFRSVQEIPAGFGPCVAAIGNFDGVHRGHREILSAAAAEARELGAQSVAVTFDPHPERFLRPAEAPLLLTPIEERLRLLSGSGIGAVLVLPFGEALAAMPAREFVRGILVEKLKLRSLHEGGNFRFGYRAEAGVVELRKWGAESGFAVHVHDAVRVHGLEVSSSAIRERVAAGDMTRARWMLGRPFSVRSCHASGRGIG